MRKLLVDTCAIIWLATGDRKLSQLARDAMRDAEFLCFSSISPQGCLPQASRYEW